MSVTLDELAALSSVELAIWMKPRSVDTDRGDMMVEAAVAAVTEAVKPRTEVPSTAKAIVLEAAARACTPRVQQESLGSRSVSYFAPGDPRSGVFLTADELAQLGVSDPGVGAIWTAAPNGAAGWSKSPTQAGRYPWSSGGVPL